MTSLYTTFSHVESKLDVNAYAYMTFMSGALPYYYNFDRYCKILKPIKSMTGNTIF